MIVAYFNLKIQHYKKEDAAVAVDYAAMGESHISSQTTREKLKVVANRIGCFGDTARIYCRRDVESVKEIRILQRFTK